MKNRARNSCRRSPTNVCVGISLLNHKSGVVASVGNDPFGDFLIDLL